MDPAVHYRATGEAVNKLLKVHADLKGDEKYLIKRTCLVNRNLEYIDEDYFTEVKKSMNNGRAVSISSVKSSDTQM